jgi:thiol-disulfide isomerase/thioredoxin
VTIERAARRIALVLALIVPGCGPRNAPPPREMPNVRLQTLAGESVPLQGFRGKVLLVDFWATWCPPCEESIPDLMRLQKRYRKDDFQVIGIALDVQGASVVAPFVKKHGVNYTILLGDERTARAFGGIVGLPTSFLIDRRGRIVERFIGVRDGATYENLIRTLL